MCLRFNFGYFSYYDTMQKIICNKIPEFWREL